MWIELFALGSIERRLVFNEAQVIFEIFGALFVEQSQFPELEELGDVSEDIGLAANAELNGLLVIARVLVDEHLNKG